MAPGQAAETAFVRERIEELRAQAKKLVDELPGVLKSQDGFDWGSSNPVLRVLMQDTPASLLERLRGGSTTPRNSTAPNGDAKDGLVDVRQYETWTDACNSIGDALSKCVRQPVDASQHLAPGQSAIAGIEPLRLLRAESDGWNGVECKSWGDFSDGHVSVVVDDTTLRLATCRKCQRVVSQQRFAAHWEHCKAFDYSQTVEPSPTNLGVATGSAVAGGALKVKIGMVRPGQGPHGGVMRGAAGAGAPLVPTKFVSAKTAAMSTSLDKKRKGEGMDFGVEDEAMIEIEVITCDGCGMSPIPLHSSRYSCNHCQDFDLCEACYNRGPAEHLGHDPTHDFCLLAIPVVSAPTGALNMVGGCGKTSSHLWQVRTTSLSCRWAFLHEDFPARLVCISPVSHRLHLSPRQPAILSCMPCSRPHLLACCSGLCGCACILLLTAAAAFK